MRKEQIKSIDFIKSICALGVVLFHFECHYTSRHLTFITNYFDSGAVVTVFFMVSGALLQYHYAQQMNLKEYYIKRWKAIYPMYYIAYIPCWMLNVVRHGSFTYAGSPFAYLYTLLGIDGYLATQTNTYHIVGEWFLGAIIVMYLLFPLIRWLFGKNKWVTVLGALALYLIFYNKPITHNSGFCTISSCLISFCLGMLFIEYRKQIMIRPVVLVDALGYVLLGVVRLKMSLNASLHLLGICLFILLFALGEKIMEKPLLCKGFTELSKLSYPVFLIHHVMLQMILLIWQPEPWWQILLLQVFTVAVILVAAKILALVTSWIVARLGRR